MISSLFFLKKKKFEKRSKKGGEAQAAKLE
jgi:hypothetical protein